MRPASVSATKISPFGAALIIRGPSNPFANSAILNPGGTFGAAPSGLGTTRETLAAERVAPGSGKSCGLIRRAVPGLSSCQLPNASLPWRKADWPNAALLKASAPSVDTTAGIERLGISDIPVHRPKLNEHNNGALQMFGGIKSICLARHRLRTAWQLPLPQGCAASACQKRWKINTIDATHEM